MDFTKASSGADRSSIIYFVASYTLIMLVTLAVSDVYAVDKRALSKGDGAKVSREEYRAFGEVFAKALTDKDMDTIAKLFDVEKFAYEIAGRVTEKPSEKKSMAKGFFQKKSQALRSLFGTVLQQDVMVKCLRTIGSEHDPKPLLRLDYTGGGHEYIVLTIRRNNSNNLVAVDMFLATTGKKSSEAIADATRLLMVTGDSILAKLLDIKKIDKNLTNTFRKIGQFRQQGKFVEAYREIESLSDDVRKSRVILDLSVGLAQSVSDEEYKKQLGLLAKYYGDDDTTLFMLIDYYFYKEDYNKVLTTVDRMMQVYGEDGALYNLKASAALEANDAEAATQFAKKAIQLEPDFADAYWALIAILNVKKEYPEMVSVFKTIEKDFGYEFVAENFKGDEFYADFVKSAAFGKWLN